MSGSSSTVDSFVGEVHGQRKQGAGFGYTKRRGYHPIALASRADTGEVLHVRLRKGNGECSSRSGSQRWRFAEELIARVARAGRPRVGPSSCAPTPRSGAQKLIARLQRASWLSLVGERQQPSACARHR